MGTTAEKTLADFVESERPDAVREVQRLVAARAREVPGSTGYFPIEVVVSGSFRKDPALLKSEYNELLELPCKILSPRNVEIEGEEQGFVFMAGESGRQPHELEDNHLGAIQRASFVWLHAPKGYVGLSGSFEIGFAHAAGIPVFCREQLLDPILRHYVRAVSGPKQALWDANHDPVRVPSAIRALQKYYGRVARMRGHDKEDAQTCLRLLREEVDELVGAASGHAAAGSEASKEAVALELADVILYTIHLANILGVDLVDALKVKEAINTERFPPVESG